jgi:ATP-dependent Clp protease protease subunit
MFEKKEEVPTIRLIELFHENNLYLNTRTVYFGGDTWNEDEVTSNTVAQVIKNLQILEYQSPGEKINLILNSCGGSWADGIGLYDMIRALKSPVIIIGIGKIYSMGSIIIQAGDYRVVTKHTTTLIHDGTDGYVGTPKSFEAWGNQSKITRQQSYQIYYEQMVKKNPKITLKKIEEMCSHDTILSAEETVNLGLADCIMEDVEKNVCFEQ